MSCPICSSYVTLTFFSLSEEVYPAPTLNMDGLCVYLDQQSKMEVTPKARS